MKQIRELDLPSVDGAAEAKQGVDGFVADSVTIVDAVKAGRRQLQAYGTDAANVAAVALPLGLQLMHLVSEAKTTISDLERIKGPFEHAVNNSDACQALKPSQDDES